MRLGKSKCDWCGCMAECAVGVGLVHPLLHRTRERNGNELQEGDMCKRWRLWRFVFSNNPCLETSWISGGVIWGRGENSRELSHIPPGESRKIRKIMDSKKYRRKGWGYVFFFQQEDICCTIFLEILGLHPRPSSFIRHLIMWHTQHWTLCNGPKIAKYTVCFSNPSYITLTYDINCILTYQRCWFKKGNLGISIPKNLHDIILQTC